MPGTIRIGLIGAGWPTWQHIKAYRKVKGVDIVALCDSNGNRLNQVADEYDIRKRYVSYEEMLEKEALDAVSICTPNVYHADMSIKAMRNGVHVLCEKPMATNSESARKMVNASVETGRILMIAYQKRFNQEIRFLKKCIENGMLGEVYFVRGWWLRRQGIPGMGGWFTQKAVSGGGALIDIGVHVLDLAMWLIGYPDVRTVSSCVGSRFGVKGEGAGDHPTNEITDKGEFDVDDYAVAHLTFGNGRSLMLQCSWASHVKENQSGIELWGDEGGARLYPLEIYTKQNDVLQDVFPRLKETNDFDEEIKHFIDCVRNGIKPLSPAEEGCRTVEIIERIYEAGENS